MINLGLNRKISNVLSKNLNDPESDIYKEISSIAGETTESDSSVNNPFGINIAECIEENKKPSFDECDLESIEELYLLNATSISNLPMERFTSLKKLMLPNLCNLLPFYDIDLDPCIAALPIEIMLLAEEIGDGGMFNCSYHPTFNSLETLVLTNCSSIGHAGLNKDFFPNLNNLVLLNKETYVTHHAHGRSTSFLSMYNNIYVPDSMIDTYVEHDESSSLEGHLKPLSELPNNLKKELELCQIQI